MQYRSDIDGLRALAILCVLLFHCGFASFSGGFVGVDVFFVISGYLITSLILADLERDRFSFKEFYVRRVRRLLPALIATVAITIPVAMLIMAPAHLAEAGRTGLFAIFSLANFYFAKGASYFDVSGAYKPFLHTWSLSVEEQFYLVWPATVFVAFKMGRRKLVAWLVGLGAIAGLAISQFWISVNPTHAYFLAPFRSFQFLLGAACVWLTNKRIRSAWLEGAIFLCGIALIVGTAVIFTEATSFPGFNAAIPSVGAALLIWTGRAPVLSWILTNRSSVWLGKISYSAYLVHWPIIVFWRYLSMEPFGVATKLALLAASCLAGYALHVLVEQRYRVTSGSSKPISWAPLRAALPALALICLVCLAMPATGGLPQRISLAPQVAAYRAASEFQFLRDYHDGALKLGKNHVGNVLIFGDSMVQNYIPALMSIDGIQNAHVDVVSRGGCVLARGAVLVNFGSVDSDCVGLRDQLYSLPAHYDLVIWAQDWLHYENKLRWEDASGALASAFDGTSKIKGWSEGIARTVDHFAKHADSMVIIGPQIAVENVNPILTRIGPLTSVVRISDTFALMREISPASRDELAEGMRTIVESHGVSFIDPRQIVCDSGTCHFWDGTHSYYMDGLHHTAAATEFLKQRLLKFKPLSSWSAAR